ncbi:hypothetical protein Tco_1069022 [Tanacetum coccineum]|uniref:Uncharacterized protein n=1 Tax=Tanacetum coccineum TaxID=301880 RepID=A0ABQ5HHB0_9ASTR
MELTMSDCAWSGIEKMLVEPSVRGPEAEVRQLGKETLCIADENPKKSSNRSWMKALYTSYFLSSFPSSFVAGLASSFVVGFASSFAADLASSFGGFGASFGGGAAKYAHNQCSSSIV